MQYTLPELAEKANKVSIYPKAEKGLYVLTIFLLMVVVVTVSIYPKAEKGLYGLVI